MKFPTEVIHALQIEVIDILDANENQAISALLYWMTAIDQQLENATSKAEQVVALELRDPESPEKQYLYTEFKVIPGESEKNLIYLLEMINHYVSGKPHKVLVHTHP